jgi:hypothetical protein
MKQLSERELVPSTYLAEIRLLYRVAMLVFVVTVGIGLLNGLDVVEFDRATLLTHVHAGTLGWITLSVFAFTLWLWQAPETSLGRGSAVLAAVSVPAYVVAFWVGNDLVRAVTGTAVLIAVYGFAAYSILAYRSGPRTSPRLATVAALVTLAIGSTIGVLLQVERAAATSLLPAEAIGGHVGAQVVGYLVLMGMALAEWRLLPDAALTRPARAQIGLLFAGGLLTSVGALTSSEVLLGVFIPLEIAALVIFVGRLVPRLRGVGWLARGSERHFGLIVPFLVANVILLVVLIAGVVSGRYADFGLIPPWLVFAFDHAMFIGVMTNGLIGLGMVLSGDRVQVWSWADDPAFWAINVGLIGFVIGLLVQSVALKRVSAPLMGAGILVALLALSMRLQRTRAPAHRPAT